MPWGETPLRASSSPAHDTRVIRDAALILFGAPHPTRLASAEPSAISREKYPANPKADLAPPVRLVQPAKFTKNLRAASSSLPASLQLVILSSYHQVTLSSGVVFAAWGKWTSERNHKTWDDAKTRLVEGRRAWVWKSLPSL